jgi:hypothetical protein
LPRRSAISIESCLTDGGDVLMVRLIVRVFPSVVCFRIFQVKLFAYTPLGRTETELSDLSDPSKLSRLLAR